MNHAITVGDILVPLVGFVVILGVLGLAVWLLYIFASGFDH